jgi:hypothetical protein
MNTQKYSQTMNQSTGVRDLIRQIAVITATLATIGVNIAASALPLNGQNTGDISDRFQVFFVPAGYVFSIWGVIYLGWLAYSVYQALPSQRANQMLRDIGGWYVLSAIANSLWLVCWHYNWFGMSLAVMFVLLGSLIMIYRRLVEAGPPASQAEKWAVRIPFSIYLGWISVATIANATSVLSLTSWNGLGLADQTWAAIMLGVATVLGVFFSVRFTDVAYVAVFVWSFVGIAVKHSAEPVVFAAALAAAAIVALSLVVALRRKGDSSQWQQVTT